VGGADRLRLGRAALAEVDREYRTAARDFQDEMTALPGPERMVELLEALRP
jgi:UDP:flavonoid glycosyltransferase YjiC (YdhE family)